MEEDFSSSVKLTLKKRAVTGVGVVVLFQIILFSVYSGLSFFDIRHPLLWIYYFSGTLISYKSWLSFLPAMLAMLLASLVTLANLTANVDKLPSSRYDIFKNSLSSRTFLRLLSYFLLILFVPITYINLTGQRLVVPCQEQSQLKCVNHENIFVLCCAYFTGFVYVLQRQLLSKHIIEFPVIRQIAFIKLRSECIAIIKECLPSTIKLLVYFIPIYLIFGNVFTAIFKFLLAAYEEQQYFYGFSLFFKSWIMSAAVYTCLKLMEKSMEIYLTQNLDLPLPKLINLLDTTKEPFIKDLAFQDLSLVAVGRGGTSISEIYALSLPGGIPHNWNTVLRQCLNVITTFQKEMDNHGAAPVAQPIPVIKPEEPRILRGLRRLTSPAQAETVCSYTTTRRPAILEYGLPKQGGAHLNVSQAVSDSLNCMLDVQRSHLSDLRDTIKNLQIVKFVFAPVPDLHFAALLESSQIVVWAIAALSGFSARALTEDKFGVAVNDLPVVVTTLLSLQKTLQQLKRKQKGSDRASRMKSALKDATSRGLLKIAKTYADHLEHLPLPQDAYIAMKTCANFVE